MSAAAVLRLSASDPEVWRRTLDANVMTNDPATSKPIPVRCKKCQDRLGSVGLTPLGVLFTSSWAVRRDFFTESTGFGAGVGRLSPKDARHILDEFVPVEQTSGRKPQKRDGTIALLTLPPELPQDYPDLMVRCEDDGDAVMDRLHLVEDVDRRKPVIWADVAWPRRKYAVAEPEIGEHSARVSRRYVEERRLRDTARPLTDAEKRRLLGSGPDDY